MDITSNKLDLAEKSFKTVIDADIHEDNKASRILSAMAFLTAAAAAIFAKVYSTGGLTIEIQQKLIQGLSPYINQTNLPEVNDLVQNIQKPYVTILGVDWALISFLGYMLFILLGASLYLAALGPSLNIPSEFRKGSKQEKPSFLFFQVIAGMKQDAWNDLWAKEDTEIASKITENYVFESYLVAQKVQAKYVFMSWGSGFFKLAILSLSFLVSSVLAFDLLLVRGFIILSTMLVSTLFILEMNLRPPKEKNRGKIWILLPIFILVILILLSLRVS